MLTAPHCFADLAREYCTWAETAPPASPAQEAATARRLLSRLYACVLDLPVVEAGALDAPGVSLEAWKSVFKRFGALPVNYYSECFNPTAVPPEAPCVGDVADDLADIWRDLKGGLWLFDQGHVDAAVYEWNESFEIHWGRHAASALFVLHCWMLNAERW